MDLGNLGNKSSKRSMGSHQGESTYIDKGFFKVDISINGKAIKLGVDNLLAFEEEDLDELSDGALDKALDQCSYYRFTFLAAGAEIEAQIEIVNRQFTSWYAQATKEAKQLIINQRKIQKDRDKVPNSWFGSITKQEIEDTIITDPQMAKKYNEFQDTLTELKKNLRILFGLRDTIQDRGGHLQSLGKRQLEHQKNFGVRYGG